MNSYFKNYQSSSLKIDDNIGSINGEISKDLEDEKQIVVE